MASDVKKSYEETMADIEQEQDVQNALTEAGFEVLARYDDYRTEPVDDKTQRIVYVCKKVAEK